MTMMESISDYVVHGFGDKPSDDASVRVWFADLDKQQADIAQLSWLPTSEHVRAARLKKPQDRRRYNASRVFIRRVLSNETGILPENVQILTDKCGKPCLNPPGATRHLPSENLLGFNVSHSENFLIIATALGYDVGVDIEVVNPSIDVLAISEACLDHWDLDQVKCSSPGERSLAFYQLWTRREAFAKMLGHGVNSEHIHHASTLPWSQGSIDITLGEKQIVGSLAIRARTTTSATCEAIP